MSKVRGNRTAPRAVIHRKILDVAESRPDASLEAIADDVSGASVDLVDRVLTEYGDPHRDDSGDSGAVEVDASSSAATGNSDGDGESLQSVPDLTEKERITLRAVAEDPDAPQSAIAEKLGVTRATVSRRLNSIEGFEWRTRREFAERVFGPSTDHEEQSDQGTAAPERVAADGYRDDVAASGGDAPADENAGTDESSEADESAEADERSTDDGANETETREASPMDADVSDDGETPGAADDPSVDAQIETLRSSISGLERRVAELDGPEQSSEVDPELVQKVIHACMNADSISEDEELIVLKRLM